MATYVNDLRLKEIATGDESGTWGTSTNTNLELIGEALGFGTEGITTNADTHTTTVADGSTDPGRAMYLKYTGTLDSACTITIAPNTISRMQFIENGTSGSQNIIISQGSGANITIPAGDTKAVYLDGAGSGAAVVDAFASLNTVDLKVEDDLTVTDDASIGGDATITGTLGVSGLLTANANITLAGTTPTLTIGDAGAEDTKIVFDGNAQDFYIGLDDSADDLVIGKGSTVGTTPAIIIDENLKVGFGITPSQNFNQSAAGTVEARFASTDDDAFLQISSDTDEGKDSVLQFLSGTSARGSITYDHNTTAASQSMIFKTGDNAVTSMTILGDGKVGIGTSSPAYELDLNGAMRIQSSRATFVDASEDATASAHIFVSNDGVGDFSQEAGHLVIQARTHTSVYRDIIFAGGINNASDLMRITGEGDVGIGITNPTFRLHVTDSSGGTVAAFSDTTSADLLVVLSSGVSMLTPSTGTLAFGTSSTERGRFTSAGKFVVGDTAALNGGGALGSFVFSGSQGVFISTVSQSTGEVMGFVHQKTSVVGTIAINSSSTTYNTSSDARLKDVTGEARGLDVINKLNPVSYNWKVDGKADEGLIAQECEDIVPNAITVNSSDYYGMDYSKLVVHLVKGMQEQQEQIEQLKTEIKTLQ